MLIRLLMFMLGLSALAFGIALVTNADLGTSALSSFAYVMSLATGWSMGAFVFATNIFFFIIQIALDRRAILAKAVKQLPICALFGIVIDAAMHLTSFLEPSSWIESAVMTLAGCICIGLGASGMIFSRLAYLPPEGTALAILNRWGGSFGTVRAGIDVSILAAAVLVSLISFGEIQGLREGTLAAALLGGPTAKFFLRCWGKLMPQNKVID